MFEVVRNLRDRIGRGNEYDTCFGPGAENLDFGFDLGAVAIFGVEDGGGAVHFVGRHPRVRIIARAVGVQTHVAHRR